MVTETGPGDQGERLERKTKKTHTERRTKKQQPAGRSDKPGPEQSKLNATHLERVGQK